MANSQLQRMLEDMYKRSAQNASPQLRNGMTQDAIRQAAADAQYKVFGYGDSVGTQAKFPGPGAYNPPATGSGMGAFTSGNRNFFPVPPGTQQHFPGPYSPQNGDAFSAANAFEARLAAAAKNNPNGIQTSPLIQDLIKKQAAENQQQPHSMADDLEAQLNALFNKPDIPGQWISPYSQDYLNQLGDRLGAAGSEGQQMFQAAKQDIADSYGRGVTNRAQAEGGIFNDLAANAKNIGVDYANGSLGKEAIADQNYLNETAALNQSNDLAFNDKLGAMVAQLGQTMGLQAREGLLTPKEWVGPQSGLTAGDQAKIGFLTNKYNRLLDTEAADAQGTDIEKYLTMLTQGASETTQQKNPLVPDFIAGISDRNLRDSAQTAYDTAGGDPTVVLKNLQDRLTALPNLTNPRITPQGSSRPLRTNADYAQVARDYLASKGLPTPGGISTAANMEERQTVNSLIDLFRQLSPTWTGVPTVRETTNSTTAKAPVGLDPTILALLLKSGIA